MRSSNYNHNNTTNYVSLNPTSDKDLRNFPVTDDSESKLHLLYPGRPMSKYYNIDRSNIPNEDGEGRDITSAAYEMLDTKNDEEIRYQKQLQKTLMAGPRPIDDPTNPKMLMQPAVDPYEMIDDPSARFTNLENPPIVNAALPIPVGAPFKENFQNSEIKDEKSVEPAKTNYYLWMGIILLILFVVIAVRMLRN